MPPPSLPPERAKVAEFYSASSGTIPPLPWQTFPPPFSSGYSDVIFARLLLATGGAAILIALGIVVVEMIRRATELAVPRWATSGLGDLLILLLQAFVVLIAASLTLLSGRSSRPILPISDCGAFIAARESSGRKPNRAAIGLAQPAA